MGSLQRSQRHILYSWIWLGSKCGMCSFSANSSILHWGQDTNVCLKSWIHQIARFQVWIIFSNFSGEGLPKELPIPPPPNLGLCFRFGLHPQFTPNMFDHFPLQGKPKIKYFTPLPQLLGYATVFYNSICRLSYVDGWPGRPGPEPGPPIFQTSRHLRLYALVLLSLHTYSSSVMCISLKLTVILRPQVLNS